MNPCIIQVSMTSKSGYYPQIVMFLMLSLKRTKAYFKFKYAIDIAKVILL